jgi:MoaA/NifB/PqqE/SkfB family radical SAM enzyme
LVVGNIQKKSLGKISRSEEAWNIIKGFYSGKRPETCVGCSFYKPIDREWLQQRACTSPILPATKTADVIVQL